ncbi:MAG: shikimate kinase AroL [Thermodesulfobacteriota bacterium]
MPGMEKNIYFIGPRASGKTSVGQELAARIGWDFLDLDEEIVSRAGQSIAGIVEKNGWEYFRRLEAEALKRACTRSRHVVSAGGGVVEKAENRNILQENGKVFLLTSEVKVLLNRLQADNDEQMRPRLTDKGVEDELEEIMQARLPLYLECAEYILDADRTVESLVEEIEIILELDEEETDD